MEAKKVLFIGLVWPEPSSSAGGTRTVQLIELFKAQGAQVFFSSAAAKSEFSFNLQNIGISEQPITLNDQSFNNFIKELQPNIVIYDKFMIEEQYGWRVQQECPTALTILDTIDLHCLRLGRQQAEKANEVFSNEHLFNDTAKREIASILRCDLSLIISEIEMDMLQKQFKLDKNILFYLPLLEEEINETTINNWKNYEEREGFTFIGNFLHEPNWHTVQTLKTKIWPVLRKKIPGVGMHIYGAYASQKVLQLNNPKENFFIHGRAENARESIAKHRILLAPILFGAGVKGKFIDAMQVGTPSITTNIGAESMSGNLAWNGFTEDDLDILIEQAAKLYNDQKMWLQAQQNGIQIINQRYNKQVYSQFLLDKINEISENLSVYRQQNFIGQVLKHHTLQSTKYLSLWIEEKSRKS
jgi:glycosyltransferase involved in cell wall biosynthesis